MVRPKQKTILKAFTVPTTSFWSRSSVILEQPKLKTGSGSFSPGPSARKAQAWPSEGAEIGTDEEFEDYPVTDDMVLLKGEFDLVSNHKEENIRGELEGIFSRKFPGITMHDVEFVKGDRSIISTPVVKKGHQRDFVHVSTCVGMAVFMSDWSPAGRILNRRMAVKQQAVRMLSVLLPMPLLPLSDYVMHLIQPLLQVFH